MEDIRVKVRGDGSQHSQPPDQLHLPPACILREREQQGCLLHISCFLCLRDEAAGRVEVGVTLAWGPAELQAFVSRWPAGFLPLGRDCLSLPFGDAQAPGLFYPQYLSCLSPLFQPLCWCLHSALTSFSLACCSGSLTFLQLVLEAPISSANHAYLELWLIFPDHSFQDTTRLTFPWLIFAEWIKLKLFHLHWSFLSISAFSCPAPWIIEHQQDHPSGTMAFGFLACLWNWPCLSELCDPSSEGQEHIPYAVHS